MRQVAVTEGDKVEAQIRFGIEVNGYGVGELVQRDRGSRPTPRSTAWWPSTTGSTRWPPRLRPGGPRRESLRYAARTELGLRAFLESGGFNAFTDSFEDLAGLEQLPGLAVQRLMADGYGFGAEGDWKTAALVRAMKVMAAGPARRHVVHGRLHLPPRIRPGRWCWAPTCWRFAPRWRRTGPRAKSIPWASAARATRCGWSSPRRPGPAVNVAMIDLGDRFRLLVNEVDVVEPAAAAAQAAGGAGVLVAAARSEDRRRGLDLRRRPAPHGLQPGRRAASTIEDFAEMLGIECLRIDGQTRLGDFRIGLRWNQASFSTCQPFDRKMRDKK